MPEKHTARFRIVMDVTAHVKESFAKNAEAEGLTMHDFVRKAVLMRHTLGRLADAGFSITLKDPSGTDVLNMPTSVFVALLGSDPRIIEHLTKMKDGPQLSEENP